LIIVDSKVYLGQDDLVVLDVIEQTT